MLLQHACRRSQADTTVDRGEANAPLTPFAGFGSPPLFGFTPSPSMSGSPITGEVQSLSTRPGRQVRSPSDRVSSGKRWIQKYQGSWWLGDRLRLDRLAWSWAGEAIIASSETREKGSRSRQQIMKQQGDPQAKKMEEWRWDGQGISCAAQCTPDWAA